MTLSEYFGLIKDFGDLWLPSLVCYAFIGWLGFRCKSSRDDYIQSMYPFLLWTAIYWGIIDKVLSYFSGNVFCQLAELNTKNSNVYFVELNTKNSNAYYSLCEKAGLWGDGYVSMGIFIVLLIIVYLWNRNKY